VDWEEGVYFKATSGAPVGCLYDLKGRNRLTFALSDVHTPVADDPSVIGSGPTVPDETTFADALEVIRRLGTSVPQSVLEHLSRGTLRVQHARPLHGLCGDTRNRRNAWKANRQSRRNSRQGD
jgi:hypothetical protein